jgi:hypothetical protein
LGFIFPFRIFTSEALLFAQPSRFSWRALLSARASGGTSEVIVEPAPMKADERREQLLLETYEARQIRVGEQISAMVMVFGMGDVEPHLMQPSGPDQ